MNHSTPGLPVHHQLPEFTQTHIHRVGDAIQPSHPLSSPSPPALNLSQHQGLFEWVSSSHQVAKQSIGVSGSPQIKNIQQTDKNQTEGNSSIIYKKTNKPRKKKTKKKKSTKKYKSNWKTRLKMAISTYSSITALNVNGLNDLIKRHREAD